MSVSYRDMASRWDNIYQGSYGDKYRGMTMEKIRSIRQMEILDSLTKHGTTDTMALVLQTEKSIGRNGTNYDVIDNLTGERSLFFVSDMDKMSAATVSQQAKLANQPKITFTKSPSANREWKVDKDMFLGLDYALSFDATSMQTLDHSTLSTAIASLKKEVHPKCQSCSENHPKENLDLMGRCKLKLERHNKKLGKLYREHNKKQYGNKKSV